MRQATGTFPSTSLSDGFSNASVTHADIVTNLSSLIPAQQVTYEKNNSNALEYQELQAIFNEWLIHMDNWKPIIHRSASSQQHSINLQTFESGSRIARFNLDDNLAARINAAFGEQLPSVLNQDWIDVSLL